LTAIPIAILNSISSNHFYFNSLIPIHFVRPVGYCNTSYTTSEYMLVRTIRYDSRV